jgi:lipoate-protein ligase B
MSIKVIDAGIVSYEESIRIQEDLLEKRIAGLSGDTVLFLENYPVLTLGRSASLSDIRNRDFFDSLGIKVVDTARGGGITYHAPGQLLVYPIIKLDPPLRDISAYIDLLEELTAVSLLELGVDAYRDVSRRGVWSKGKKIAFTGVKFKKWVTSHGVAVNINNDIFPFEMIDPCGDPGIKAISARKVKGDKLDMRKVKEVFGGNFSKFSEKGLNHAVKVT